jgi:malate dehydrogenase (oxaloacetate-decarboxylating)
VLAGAGAAGIGIARLLAMAMREAGMPDDDVRRALVLVDSSGLVHEHRDDIDPAKRQVALSAAHAAGYGLSLQDPGRPALPSLEAVVGAVRPSILIGTTGQGGRFSEALIRSMAAHVERPIILPLSNPTVKTEAAPEDVLRWTDGRALVATGSPFPAVDLGGDRFEIGQANNVFIFPGVGHAAMITGARSVSDAMFLAAAHALAGSVSQTRLDEGALYPPVGELRAVSRDIAIAVGREAVESGIGSLPPDIEIEGAVDAASWWPEYAPYLPA